MIRITHEFIVQKESKSIHLFIVVVVVANNKKTTFFVVVIVVVVVAVVSSHTRVNTKAHKPTKQTTQSNHCVFLCLCKHSHTIPFVRRRCCCCCWKQQQKNTFFVVVIVVVVVAVVSSHTRVNTKAHKPTKTANTVVPFHLFVVVVVVANNTQNPFVRRRCCRCRQPKITHFSSSSSSLLLLELKPKVHKKRNQQTIRNYSLDHWHKNESRSF